MFDGMIKSKLDVDFVPVKTIIAIFLKFNIQMPYLFKINSRNFVVLNQICQKL